MSATGARLGFVDGMGWPWHDRVVCMTNHPSGAVGGRSGEGLQFEARIGHLRAWL